MRQAHIGLSRLAHALHDIDDSFLSISSQTLLQGEGLVNASAGFWWDSIQNNSDISSRS